jgi:hypothetical protein
MGARPRRSRGGREDLFLPAHWLLLEDLPVGVFGFITEAARLAHPLRLRHAHGDLWRRYESGRTAEAHAHPEAVTRRARR